MRSYGRNRIIRVPYVKCYWYQFEIINDYQIQLYYLFQSIAVANIFKKEKYVQ